MEESRFTTLEKELESGGAPAAFDRLAEILKAEKKYPQLFEALLMKKRHELGLPLEGSDSLSDLPEEFHQVVEDYYIETCRTVGSLFLQEGDIPSAWPYFRAIDEPEAVARALESWEPKPSEDEDGGGEGEASDTVIDIAFNQGAHPARGFELILSHHGTCRAVSAYEHQFPYKGEVKESCGRQLVRHLYGELLESLRSDIAGRGEEVPEGSTVRSLIEGRPELFGEHGYHIDVSHLASVVRAAAGLEAREELEIAIELCDYGRKLSRDFHVSEEPPFEDFYNDYRILLRALVGQGADGAVRYFTGKADRAPSGAADAHLPGEVVVHLLYRIGRYPEATEAYLKYLKDAPVPLSLAPSLAEISDRSGDYSRLLELSMEKDDLLQYAAALVKRRDRESRGN